MSKYAKYKKVNEKWVDKIPAYWEMKRLKGIFALRNEKNNPVKTDRILSLTAKQGVIPYEEKDSMGGNKPKADLTKYNVCHVNDLLVNCMNVVSGSAGVSKYEGAISPVYYALYPHKNDNVWYYHHIFRLEPFQKSLVGLGKGILMHESEEGKLTSVRMRISMDYLGNIMLPVPPKEEQDKIVNYLNWKVSNLNRITNYIRNQVISALELRKTVVTNIFLLKQKNEEKNISKYMWIGEVPKYYEVLPLKRLCRKIIDGTHRTPTYVQEGIPFLRVKDISSINMGNKINWDKVFKIPIEEHKKLYLRCNPEKNDVLVSKNGTIGVPIIVDWDDEVSMFVSLCLLKLNDKVLPEWIYYYFLTSLVNREIAYGGKTGTITNLHLNKIKEFKIPLPDIEKQKEISHIISKKN